jgi:hypothetical protein
MKPLATQVRALGTLALAPLLALVTVFSTVGVASAAPTAAFTYGPTAPAVREPVTFRFTGTCDVEPCSIEWRWFQAAGSTLGTTMGRGDVLTYAFPRAGNYTVRAKITNATSTHGSDFTSQSVDVTGTFENNDRRIGYDGWTAALSSRASNGGYRVATDTSIGSEAAYRFTGTEVTYVANAGPNRGIALVTVAGRQQQVDLYAPTHGPKSFLVNGLTDAPHRIRVQPTGTKNEASTGTAVTVDGFVAGTTQVDDTSLAVEYNSWVGTANASASGGTIRNSATTGARTSFVFWGPSVTWVSASGPNRGIANVSVDGAALTPIDGYSRTHVYKVEHTFSGLGEGRHVLRVAVSGTRNPSSTANRVGSDAFIVR